MILYIARTSYDIMRRDAERLYPEECCGVLIGKIADSDRRTHQIVPCQNIRNDDACKRYEIDPAELVRAQRTARESGMEIVGFYHSHPDHPARPSPTDLEHAHWIGCSYVIISVVRGKAAEPRSYFLGGTREEDKRFVEQRLIID